MNTQYRKNLKAVAQACKDYTDKEIKKVYYDIGHNDITTEDHTDEATYRFTAPLNSKLLMLQSIAGNSNKITPSTASDSTLAFEKTLPDNTYELQVNYIGGMSYKYNQLVANGNFENVDGWSSWVYGNSREASNNECHLYGLTNLDISRTISVQKGHKVLIGYDIKGNEYSTISYLGFSNSAGGSSNITVTSSYQRNFGIITMADTPTRFYIYCLGNNASNEAWVKNVNIFDLTSDFGSGNEPASVSDARTAYLARGVNIDEYNAHSLPTIRDTKNTAINVYGKNFFDISKVLQSAIVSVSGNKITKNSSTYNVDLFTGTDGLSANVSDVSKIIHLKAGTYNISYNATVGGLNVVYFDDNGNFIGTLSRPFTLSKDTYISLRVSTNALTEISNIMINIGSTTLPFEPYIAPLVKQIPASVQALDGYGYGLSSSLFNYVDLISLKFKKYVDSYTFIGNETWTISTTYAYTNDISNFNGKANSHILHTIDNISSMDVSSNGSRIVVYLDTTTYDTSAKINAITTGKTIHYELSSVVETDISSYIDSDFKKFITNNQYVQAEMVNEHNANLPSKLEYYGTIIHSLATAVKQEGFNIWDEELVVGALISDGSIDTSLTTRRTTSYIEVIPNQTIYLYNQSALNNGRYAYYDSEKNLVEYNSNGFATNTTTITIPSGVYYLRITLNVNYGTTYKNDICINISNQDLNGTYKPYKAPITRLLPNSEAKYSWGITDGVRNTRVFCDDECNPVNEGKLDVNNVNLGTLSYSRTTSGDTVLFYGNLPLPSIRYTTNLLNTKYQVFNSYWSTAPNKRIGIMVDNASQVGITDSDYATSQNFKNDMSGVPLFYQKNATDTETLDDFDFSFDCEEGDTFTIIGCELLQCYATYSFLIKEAKSNE